MPVLGDLNAKAISLEELSEVLNKIKSVKPPGLNGFPVKCLKKVGIAVLKWQVGLLTVSFVSGLFCLRGVTRRNLFMVLFICRMSRYVPVQVTLGSDRTSVHLCASSLRSLAVSDFYSHVSISMERS